MLEFDYLTDIEKILVQNGYCRFRYDFKKNRLVQMNLKGDVSYYFSSMGNISFHYRKNDIIFTVGLNEKYHTPHLFDCNKQIVFNGKFFFLGQLPSILVQRMFQKVNGLDFLVSVENNKSIDFDMLTAEKLYYEELATKKRNKL